MLSEPQNHADLSALSTLSLDTKPSSSPFPSPSSSFLPPPMPGAHEYALKLPKRGSNTSFGGLKREHQQQQQQQQQQERTSAGIASPSGSASASRKSSPSPSNSSSSPPTTPTVHNAYLPQAHRPGCYGSKPSSMLESAPASASTPALAPALVTVSASKSSTRPTSVPATSTSASDSARDFGSSLYSAAAAAAASVLGISRPKSAGTFPIIISTASPVQQQRISLNEIPIPPTPSSPTSPPPNTNIITMTAGLADPNPSPALSTHSTHSTHSTQSTYSTASTASTATSTGSSGGLGRDQRHSLSSTRPAPPSPAVSRRASSIRSRSSRSSRPGSTVFWDIDGQTDGATTPAVAAAGGSGPSLSRGNSIRRGSERLSVGLSPFGAFTPIVTPTTTGTTNTATLVAPQKRLSSSQAAQSEPSSTITNQVMQARPSSSSSLPPQPQPQPRPSSSSLSSASQIKNANEPESEPESELEAPQQIFIQIRDFAFAYEDERHHGRGAYAPKSNHPGRLNKLLGRMFRRRQRLQQGSSANSSDDDDDDDDEDMNGEDMVDDDDEGGSGGALGATGYGGYGGMYGAGGDWDSALAKMNQAGRLSWMIGVNGGGGGGGGGGSGDDGGEEYPSQSDMERNFVQDGREEGEYYEEEEEGTGEEEPLYPGLYRALYAFEPEGTAEMALEEDQIVKVVGRGGGVGWAVVVKNWVPDEKDPEGGAGRLVRKTTDENMDLDSGEMVRSEHALVPEGYLELVREE